jgi:O-antigen ligase
MQNLQSTLGIIALLAFAYLISERRHAVSLKRLLIGLAITFVLAVVFLKIPQMRTIRGRQQRRQALHPRRERARVSFSAISEADRCVRSDNARRNTWSRSRRCPLCWW